MNKFKRFSQKLNRWYRGHARFLPWRETRDPYKIWISEIMLQQTTVNTVIPYYQRWVKQFPDAGAVAKAPLQKVLKAWQGLGYYSRARNIHRAAQLIVREFRGKMPRCSHALAKLPGFGPYTIGAVLSIAFDQRQPVVDANVRRVVMRLLAIEGHATGTHDKAILAFLNSVMPKKNLRTFNQALMELGALVCRTNAPFCLGCPVKEMCLAYDRGIQEVIPAPKKQIVRNINVAVGVIKKGEKYFIQQRPSRGLLAGLWEFPGGEIETGEAPEEALARELKEEIGVHPCRTKFRMCVQHFYTQFRVKLHVFDCELATLPSMDATRKWVSLRQIRRYPMPSGSAKIVSHMLQAQL